MRILGTDETKVFGKNEAQEAKALISALEETITYDVISKKALMAGEVINAPILPQAFTSSPAPVINPNLKGEIAYPKLESGKTFTIKLEFDEQMKEAMENSKLVLGFAENGKDVAEPLALNALPSLVAQAIGGKSSMLCQTEDKTVAKCMNTEVKAAIINEFLRLRNDKCKKYVCDGMVRYIASEGYQYLPISELLQTLEDGLAAMYPKYTFEYAKISHQFDAFCYYLNDEKLTQELLNILQMTGASDDFKPALLFVTSNTGDSGANLIPVMFTPNGGLMYMEEPLKLEHDGGASVEKFKGNVDKLLAVYQATPEKLQKMEEVILKHPANAYRNVAFKSNIPLDCFAEKAEIFEQIYGQMASALDLYIELVNEFSAYCIAKDVNEMRKLKILGSLSQKFLSVENLQNCDVDIDFTKVTK